MWHIHEAARPFRLGDAQAPVPTRPSLRRGERARTPVDARVHDSGSVQMEENVTVYIHHVTITCKNLLGTSIYNISDGFIKFPRDL